MMTSKRWKCNIAKTSFFAALAVFFCEVCLQFLYQYSSSGQELHRSLYHSWLGVDVETQLQEDQKEPKKKDWFDPYQYDKGKKKCFFVEDMCHSSNRWFYRANVSKHQPNFGLEMFSKHTPKRRYGYNKLYSPSRMNRNQTEELKCIDSPVQNHIILQSWYNDMLGEFYDRTLVGLLELLDSQNVSIDDFIRHSQLYIHRMDPFKPLLESHHLFTNAFRSSPLGDFLDLFHDTQCRCLPRVLFCGYKERTDPENRFTKLTPTGGIFSRSKQHTPIYKKMRNFLRENVILRNPFAQKDIQNFRAGTIQRQRSLHNETLALSEWKIIGLAQRTRRRKWMNLTQLILSLTPSMSNNGIALIEVNVEDDDWTPYRQMVRHAALDGLIGIHGAQLTEAVWMKPGSLIAELLPYIPKNLTTYGRWTARTHQPTPLGVIFDETDLLHVGYALGRESAPYCYNASDKCWGSKSNPWDGRDFIASSEIIEELLNLFVVNRPVKCDDYKTLSLTIKNLVVYNAPCSQTDKSLRLKSGHFYWNETTKQIS